MKLNPPNAHRSQIKICEKRQTRNVQFRFMQNAFRILKPIQKSSKCVLVFRNTGANAFAKNQTHLAYEDKRDLYCRSVYIFDCQGEGINKLLFKNVNKCRIFDKYRQYWASEVYSDANCTNYRIYKHNFEINFESP